MAKQRFANNASARLATGINSTETEVIVEVGQGERFPEIGSGEWFLITLENVQAEKEVMRVIARSGDAMTVIRGQENTPAQAFNAGARVEVRVTAGTLDLFLQRGGDSMEGDLDMDGNELQNVDIRGGSFQGSEVVAVLRGDLGLDSNEILVPSNGDPATAGGAVIFTAANPPSYTQLEDTTGTPSAANFLRGDGEWANELEGNFTVDGDFTVTGEITGELDWGNLQNVPEAAVGTVGIVGLSDDLDDDSVTTAATANAVKQLADAMGAGSSEFAAAGHVNLTNGLQIKWGLRTGIVSGNNAVTFASGNDGDFDNACLNVQLTAGGVNNSERRNAVTVTNLSVSGFTIVCAAHPPGTTMYWLAIGH